MAPLQKRALYGLLFGLVWAASMGAVLVIKGGASAFDKDQGFRLIVDGMWVGGLVLYWVLFATIMRRRGQFDERDRIIMDRSVKAQWVAVILSLAAWLVGLSEAYRVEGQVPIVFLYLMFIYTLVASAVAQCAGILIGYWTMDRHA